MEKIRQFLENGKWKRWKKSDWIVVALVGMLLMVIVLPIDGKPPKEPGKASASSDTIQIEGVVEQQKEEKTYVVSMEEKLESVLTKMDGVGKVEVMITVSDKGEYVIEKDRQETTTITSEMDSAGGVRSVTERDSGEAAVYVENGEGTCPYVQKEKLPAVTGVIVVAEGGGNSRVVSEISDAVKALFPIEAHRIKVVKMCSKEE